MTTNELTKKDTKKLKAIIKEFGKMSNIETHYGDNFSWNDEYVKRARRAKLGEFTIKKMEEGFFQISSETIKTGQGKQKYKARRSITRTYRQMAKVLDTELTAKEKHLIEIPPRKKDAISTLVNNGYSTKKNLVSTTFYLNVSPEQLDVLENYLEKIPEQVRQMGKHDHIFI